MGRPSLKYFIARTRTLVRRPLRLAGGGFAIGSKWIRYPRAAPCRLAPKVPSANRQPSPMRGDDVPAITYHVSGRFLTGTNRTHIIAKTPLRDAGQGCHLDKFGSWRGVSLVAGSRRGDASNTIAPISRSPITATKIVTSRHKLTPDTRQPRNSFSCRSSATAAEEGFAPGTQNQRRPGFLAVALRALINVTRSTAKSL
jgi:hypothetical protein